MMQKVFAIIGGLALVIGLVLGGGFWFVYSMAKDAYVVGDAFVHNISQRDYDAAYSNFHEALQKEISRRQLENMTLDHGLDNFSIVKWTSWNINDGVYTIEGDSHSTRGQMAIVTLKLTKVQDDGPLRIFSFNYRPATVTP